jgi:response regulator NasT
MERDELRHETLNLLQTIYTLMPRLQRVLPPDAKEARLIIDQMLDRARQAKDKIHGVAAANAIAPLAQGHSPRLRVVVVEDEVAARDGLVEIIRDACHHDVVAVAGSGPEMVREVLAHKPDLVVFDIHLPGTDGLTALSEITKELAVAAVAITGDRNQQLLERALEDLILAYLFKPVDAHQISAAIQVAWARFREFDTLKSKDQTLQQNLEDRKTIEKAKGMLMKWNGWQEMQAFRTLQTAAMDRRVAMVQVAHEVLAGQNLKSTR